MTVSSSAARHRHEKTYEHASTLAKIERLWPPGEKLRVFDVGCGDARLSRELLADGHVVSGIDANAAAVKEAKKAGIKASLGDAESRWPVRANSQDVVLLVDILEHTVDQEKVLGEARRVLKPGGSLIVTYLNHFHLRNRLEILFGKSGIVHWDHRQYDARAWSYTHYRYLTAHEFRSLLREQGFTPDIEQFNFMGAGVIPGNLLPASARRWLTGRYPALISGKFIVRARPEYPGRPRRVVLDHTPRGL